MNIMMQNPTLRMNTCCFSLLVVILMSFMPTYAAVCGDGFPELPEQCDEGDKNGQIVNPFAILNGTAIGCLSNCTLNTTSLSPTCGNERADPLKLKECDFAGTSVTCNLDCTFVRSTDRKVFQLAQEQCDTGGETANCTAIATLSYCGDNIINQSAGEACDDGALSPTCTDKCKPSFCGDGIVNFLAISPEQCDQGAQNGQPGSMCSSTCQLIMPLGGSGPVMPTWGWGVLGVGIAISAVLFEFYGLPWLKAKGVSCKYSPCYKSQPTISVSTDIPVAAGAS